MSAEETSEEASTEQLGAEESVEAVPQSASPQLGVRFEPESLAGVGHFSAGAATDAQPPALPLRTLAELRERLGPVEFRRRLWHIVPGFLPFLLWPIPAILLPPPIRLGILAGVTIAFGIGMFVRYARIRRPGEPASDRFSILAYSGSVLATFLLFPLHTELGLTVLAVLAFGDGSATLGGLFLGGRKLAWNEKKSLAGTACFVVFGTMMGAIIYWGEANGRQLPELAVPVSFASSLACAFFASFIAGIVESLPLRTNDNLNVGVAASLAAALAQTIFVGW